MNDIDHLTIHHGEIDGKPHLWLVSSNEWPDESDTDTHYDEPVRRVVDQSAQPHQRIDIWSAIALISLGAFIVSVVWFQVGGS